MYQYTAHRELLYYGVIMHRSLSFSIFVFFYDGPVDMQIRALPARSQKRVFQTQVTFKACEPLLDLVAIVI